MEENSFISFIAESLKDNESIFFDASIRGKERVFLFDSSGAGKSIAISSEINSTVFSDSIGAMYTNNTIHTCSDKSAVNKGVLKTNLETKKIEVEIYPVDNGLHMWIRAIR